MNRASFARRLCIRIHNNCKGIQKMTIDKMRPAIRAALAAMTLCAAASAEASYIAAIDEFTVTRAGAAFFNDTFSDGVAPPSAPNFANGTAAGYTNLLGAASTETGGKFFM